MLSVIIPVYNNEKTIEAVVTKVNSLPIEKEIIVVNDCSNDKTALILSSISLRSLKVIHHASNRGKVAVMRTGIENATGEFIVIQKADLKYDPVDYLKLLEALNNQSADIVLGLRFAKMRKSAFIPSLVATVLLNVLFNVRLSGWFTCCWLIRKNSLLDLPLNLNNADTAFEVLKKAVKKKMRIIEVPV